MMRMILRAALFAILAPSATIAPNMASHHTVPRLPVSLTSLQGSNWAYSVPFPVKNKEIIEKLISCESEGVNIASADSDGNINWGILQFNGTTTWQEMETRFNLRGSPMIPADAIRLADAMISAGFLGKWTCAHLLDLVKRTEPEPSRSER